MLARTRVGVLLFATMLGLLIGLPSSSSAATPAPKVGSCHQLFSLKQLAVASDTKPAVSCTQRHSTQTVAVVTSPTSQAGLTGEERGALGSRLCQPVWDKALGRNAVVREQTAWQEFFFFPTPAQVDAGARWIRCDVGMLAGTRPISLPKKKLAKPIIGTHIDNAERRCLTSRNWVTPCSQKHVLRSIGAVVVRASSYPSGPQVVRAANRGCPKSWYSVMPPSQVGWEDGNHVAVCYQRTRK
jgi:hypothetical protein